MPSVKNIKVTIGGPESTPGSPETREFVVPIRAVPGLDKTIVKTLDPVIIGSNMDAGEYTVADSVAGPIPLAPRGVGGFGQLLKSLLGTEATPQQIGAAIRIRYKGAEASCKIVADTTGDTLKSYIGDKGAEILDTNFGTSGTIDLTDPTTDTVGELVTVINGYSDYECEKLIGADSVDAADIADGTLQAKNMWAYYMFTSATSGAYAHIFTADLSDTERPAYSIQKDGFQDNFLYAGCVTDALSLAAALKGMVEGEATILGFTETVGQGGSGLSLENAKPFIFHTGSFALAAKDYTFLRNINLSLGNNHNPEGYGLTSTSRQYHQKGKFEVTGDFQLRLDSDSYAERAKVFANTLAGLSFLFKGKTIAGSVPELMLVELPYCQYSAFEFPENSGILDAKINFKVFKPGGTIYNEPVKIWLITEDSAAY